MDDEAKQRQRTIGVELVEMLVAFLGDSQRDWTAEIAKLGARYAELAHGAGLSRADAQRAFHLFEGIVRASVDELGAARVGSADLEANVGWFLNEVRVAMVESFA